MDSFRRQLRVVAALPDEMSRDSLLLLGICHARTGLDTQSLSLFLYELDSSLNSRLITPEESEQVKFQIYLGALGKAREMLTGFKREEGKKPSSDLDGNEKKGEMTGNQMCDLCGKEKGNHEESFEPQIGCHFYHRKCAQVSIRAWMMCGDSVPIKCPNDDCVSILTPIDLERLFPVEDLQILLQYWSQSSHTSRYLSVTCPTVGCNSSVLWRQSQYFSCVTCKKRHCLHCCKTLDTRQLGHECAEHSLEDIEAGEEFAKGKRFLVCPKCEYWCEMTGKDPVLCRCGIEFCPKCANLQDLCKCHNCRSWLGTLENLPSLLLKGFY